MPQKKPFIVVILGPTASGKSGLAVKLAKKFNGEVISADSRQVYKGLDIGTGKITKREMQGVPHHLLDITELQDKFSVAEYQKKADAAIKNILKRNRLPIICGGTGLYIDAVISNQALPSVPPSPTLRKRLATFSPEELYKQLKKLDPRRAEEIDKHNPHRLVRALEIVLGTGKPVPTLGKTESHYDVLKIGIHRSKPELQKLIARRLKKRFRQGMIREAKRLHKNGLSFKRMEELGLEYRYLAKFLQGNLTRPELESAIAKGNLDYAKRQMTWWKRDKEIHWIKDAREAGQLIKKALKTQ